MIADLKPETLASVIEAIDKRPTDFEAAASDIERVNLPLGRYLSALLAVGTAGTDGQLSAILGILAALIAVHKTESASELQRLMVGGADSEQDRASPENPDGDGQQTAHDDSKTRE